MYAVSFGNVNIYILLFNGTENPSGSIQLAGHSNRYQAFQEALVKMLERQILLEQKPWLVMLASSTAIVRKRIGVPAESILYKNKNLAYSQKLECLFFDSYAQNA